MRVMSKYFEVYFYCPRKIYLPHPLTATRFTEPQREAVTEGLIYSFSPA